MRSPVERSGEEVEMDRVEYFIVDESGTFAAEELQDRVNHLLQQGWQRAGPVRISEVPGIRRGRRLRSGCAAPARPRPG